MHRRPASTRLPAGDNERLSDWAPLLGTTRLTANPLLPRNGASGAERSSALQRSRTCELTPKLCLHNYGT